MQAPKAGNTVNTMQAVDVNVAAASLTETVAAAHIEAAAEPPTDEEVAAFHETTAAAAAELAENEPVEDYVTREEFDELLERINAFNARSGQKI